MVLDIVLLIFIKVASFVINLICFLYKIFGCDRTNLDINCKVIGVPKIDGIDYLVHQKKIQLHHLKLKLSRPLFLNEYKKFIWDKPLPDVRLYLLTHTGCYYFTVASIILKHKKPTTFYIPISDNLIGTFVEFNMKRLEYFGHVINVGGVSDERFLLRMIRGCKKNDSFKIIMFVDLPRIASIKSNYSEAIFFRRKSTIVTGHLAIIKLIPVTSCLISASTMKDFNQKIHCSRIFSPQESFLLENILSFIESHIQFSAKDWKYLSYIEFYSHFYK